MTLTRLHLVVFCTFANLVHANTIETLHQWSTLEYDNDYQGYNPKENILGNVRSFRDQFYVCVPRWRDGVPSTLNVLQGSKLRPFPDLLSNEVGNCEKGLQNVAALDIDPFAGILWAVDSGTSAIFSRPLKKCAAKLVKINLQSSSAVAKLQIVHIFPKEVITDKSVVMQMVMDKDNIYMSDSVRGAIIILDRVSLKSRILTYSEATRPQNHAFKLPDGQTTYLRLGVTGIALQKPATYEQMLFFGSIGSDTFAVPSSGSNDTTRSETNTALTSIMKGTALEAMVADDQHSLYIGLVEQPRIMRLNFTGQALNSVSEEAELIVASDDLSWINSMWISDNYLWFTHNSFQLYTSSKIDFQPGEVNFGIHRIKLDTNLRPYYSQSTQNFVSTASIILLFFLLTQY